MKRNNQKGFTLVELTLVILLIGVVAAFIIPAFANSGDSAQINATNTVKGYITEYKSNHTTDHVDDVTVIHTEENLLYIFGYSFDEDVLYLFAGANWLVQAQGNMQSTTFAHVASNIVTSANHDSGSIVQTENPYPDAEGIFRGTNNIASEFSKRTQRKMKADTLFLDAKINTDYMVSYSGIDYRFIRADGKNGSNTATAKYTTTFDPDNGSDNIVFRTANEDTFICPADPVKSGKQFLYWRLTEVNGEEKNIAGTALVPGDEYDVPNSNVVYKAVYGSTTPEQKNGAYQIYGAEHLKWFADYVNDNHGGANAVLVRSFEAGTLSTAIGTKDCPYHGTFDGNGKTIMKLKMTASGSRTHTALFGYTNGAVIKDLTLSDPQIKGNTYVSVLVAEAVASVNNTTGAYTSEATKITNCKITNASVTCNDIKAADGATDEEKETLAQTSIFKDRYKVDPTDPESVVLDKAEKGTYCGGLVGAGENIEIRECTVSGTIAGGNNGVAVGGIMGCAFGTHVVIGRLGSDKIGASSEAVVSGVRFVGGLIGKTEDSADIAKIEPAVTVSTGVEVYNSFSAGQVMRSEDVMVLPSEGYLKTTKTEYCIGFGGLIGGTQNSFLTVTGCDTAKAAKTEIADTSSYVGGILGFAKNGQIALNTTVNNGTVSGNKSVGGVVGASANVRLVITDCTNNGKVTANNMSAGGILGYAKTSLTNTRAAKVVQIINSTNNAAVKAPKRAGGILGDAERKVTIQGCANRWTVTETFSDLTALTKDTGCGGIVGYSVGTLIITDCVNEGTVRSYCQGVGGIVGKATGIEAEVKSDVPTADEVAGVVPAEPDPETETEQPEMVSLKAEYSEITRCINKGMVENVPENAEDLVTMPEPEPADPEADPADEPAEVIMPYRYAGGIIGYASEIVTIEVCTNASYVSGQSYVGGIAGAFADSEIPDNFVDDDPEGSLNPNVKSREPGEDPTQSAIRRSMSVGIVEIRHQTTEDTAGAIIGSDEYSLAFSHNVYLADMVQRGEVASVIITENAEARTYGTELASNRFMTDGAGSALAYLNGGIVDPELPVYALPDNTDPENPAVFNYAKSLTDRITAYAEQASPITVTLPTFLPEFAA